MSNEQDDFKQLRRLLALKRHEQPPPGYFNHFSRNVIAGIRAGPSSRRSAELPWFRRIWEALESKPVVAGVFGSAVCGLLLVGLVFSEQPEGTSMATAAVPENQPLWTAQAQDSAALFRKTEFSSTEGVLATPVRANKDVFIPGGIPQPQSPLFRTLEYKPGQN
jgi:hypothetical protein